MTSIFVIYKIRDQQGVWIFARMVEAYYNRERCQQAIISHLGMLSPAEKSVGWDFMMEEVQIIDQLETSPE